MEAYLRGKSALVTGGAIAIGKAVALAVAHSGADMPDELWHKVIDLNLASTFSCARSALRHLPHGGRIVNTSLAGVTAVARARSPTPRQRQVSAVL